MSSSDLVTSPDRYVFRYHLRNTHPVELGSLTNALKAIEQEFTSYAKENGGKPNGGIAPVLYVRTIERGSIIVDLVESASECMLPLAETAMIMVQFGDVLCKCFSYLKGKLQDRPKWLNATTAKNCVQIIEPIAKDTGGNVELGVHKGDNTANSYYNCIFVQGDYEPVSREAEKIRKEETGNLPDNLVLHVLLKLSSIQEGAPNKTYDRGIVEDLDAGRKYLIMESEAKIYVTKLEGNPFQMFFDVDVIPVRNGGKIVAYRVLKIHSSFPQEITN